MKRWTRASILSQLRRLADARVRAKMGYFGVHVKDAYGISVPVLHALARKIGKNHDLAEALWTAGNHEARILATLIGEPAKVTAVQMERWARDFDSCDVVDAACCYQFAHSKPAWNKARAWASREEEFVKRASFSLLAYLAYKDKAAPDSRYERFLPIIRREGRDERNFVKKAVNWALRNIGKRNVRLNRVAIRTAEEMRRMDSPSARWIAADALRELRGEAVQKRLKAKHAKH